MEIITIVKTKSLHPRRAVDTHSFYAYPDPAVFLNADPDTNPEPDRRLCPAYPNLYTKKKKIFNLV